MSWEENYGQMEVDNESEKMKGDTKCQMNWK